MSAPRYEPLDPAPLRELLAGSRSALVAFDVDLVLVSPTWEVRPGAVETLRALLADGHRVCLWTGAGRDHAVEAAQRLGLDGELHSVGGKPPFPPTANGAARALGALPDLVVDDDPGEAVPGVPFFLVQAFWGSAITQADLDAYEAAAHGDPGSR